VKLQSLAVYTSITIVLYTDFLYDVRVYIFMYYQLVVNIESRFAIYFISHIGCRLLVVWPSNGCSTLNAKAFYFLCLLVFMFTVHSVGGLILDFSLSR
jgi:hypothetical protein